MTKISLSRQSILAHIYAETAMRHLLNDNRPAMLHRDRQKALNCLIDAAFADICIALIPAITDCSIGDDVTDSEIMTIEVELPPTVKSKNTPILRASIERAISRKALAEAYEGVDEIFHEKLLDDFKKAVNRCRRILGSGPVGRLRPHWM